MQSTTLSTSYRWDGSGGGSLPSRFVDVRQSVAAVLFLAVLAALLAGGDGPVVDRSDARSRTAATAQVGAATGVGLSSAVSNVPFVDAADTAPTTRSPDPATVLPESSRITPTPAGEPQTDAAGSPVSAVPADPPPTTSASVAQTASPAVPRPSAGVGAVGLPPDRVTTDSLSEPGAAADGRSAAIPSVVTVRGNAASGSFTMGPIPVPPWADGNGSVEDMSVHATAAQFTTSVGVDKIYSYYAATFLGQGLRVDRYDSGFASIISAYSDDILVAEVVVIDDGVVRGVSVFTR